VELDDKDAFLAKLKQFDPETNWEQVFIETTVGLMRAWGQARTTEAKHTRDEHLKQLHLNGNQQQTVVIALLDVFYCSL